ncbi:MAG: translocation/assembly module TamB domain-containing protein [Cytophagaceae bacterium]|nr:translocation/assembly module TamB domain-containing protein [Cytophagaceae bacterium]MDW8456833.1 translocation/assembly module TamB domain-containing protein [Cytophagaceae bacterium]
MMISLVSLFTLLAALILAVQYPPVQKKIVRAATEYAYQLTGFNIFIGSVSVDWFDKISVENICLKDPENNDMISIQKIELDYTILSLLRQKINIDNVSLINGQVNLIKYDKKDYLNIDAFAKKIQELTTSDAPKDSLRKPVPFVINKITLKNMLFSYRDHAYSSIKGQFNHGDMIFDSIYATVDEFKVIRDTVAIDIHNLKTRLRESHIVVDDLDTKFVLTDNSLEFHNLNLQIGDTRIRDFFEMRFSSYADMSDFTDKVILNAHFKDSHIHSKDVAHFAPFVRHINDYLHISGDFSGTISRFMINHLDLHFGKSSHISGHMHFIGLPQIEQTFIEVEFKKMNVYTYDLAQYLNKQSYELISKLKLIQGKGEFVGLLNDFVANGSFNTPFGNFKTDVNFKLDEHSNKPHYSGEVITENLDIGTLFENPLLQKIDMTGTVEGEGFTKDDAKINLDAKITKIGIHKYQYSNIVTKATLSKRMFNGDLTVRDTNLIFHARGKIDFTKEGEEVFDLKANITRANLHALNISPADSKLISDFDVSFTGTDPDKIVGKIFLRNTFFTYDHKYFFLKSLYAESQREGNQHIITVDSDILDFRAEGDFTFTRIASDFEILSKEYALYFKQNAKEIQEYYRKKKVISEQKQTAEFSLYLKNVNHLLSMYIPDVYISSKTLITGSYSSGYTKIINLNTYIDSIVYKGNEIYNTTIDLSTSKVSDSSNVLASLYVNSKKQNLNSIRQTENFVFDAVWDDLDIDFSCSVKEFKSNNHIVLSGILSFLKEQKLITFKQSYINILDKKWNIKDSARVYLNESEISFHNLRISNNDQYISVIGAISERQNKEALFTIKSLELAGLNSVMPVKLSGILDGAIKIKNIFSSPDVTGYISAKDLYFEQIKIGDVNGTTKWNPLKEELDLTINVERDGVQVIKTYGRIFNTSHSDKEQVQLTANLDNADLSLIAPLFKGVASNIQGKAVGNLQITGRLNDIDMTGEILIKHGKIKIDYLGTSYSFSDKIYFSKDNIRVKKMRLVDKDGDYIILSGGLYHDGFSKFVVDLDGAMKNFSVLQTTEKDNSLFYGDAKMTGNLSILGPFENLEINIDAKSEKDTRIFIPVNSPNTITQQDYIVFKKHGHQKKNKDSIDLSGILMNFNMEITPDAYTEIIFDKVSGDIIRARGQGNLKLNIDTRGDFNMYGNYTIHSGAYNFTMAGLISKEFNILKNSTIQWSGDPYTGLLDIKAKYTQPSSLKPLIQDSILRNSPDAQRSYEVDVLLGLKGNLLSPEISLDIQIPRPPSNPGLSTIVTEFLTTVKNNDQELNRQVFSVIMLGRLSAPNSFSGAGSSNTNSVSEVFSNQLSHFLSQVDENLQIDVNLKNFDRDALNTFRMRLAYTTLDGRLRITRDGNFQNVQNSSQANISNIAGEWTVEYLISEDGRFRMKLFNKINNNSLLTSLNNTSTSAGFSLIHTQSFNSLSELIQSGKKQNKPEEKKQESPQLIPKREDEDP